MGRIVKMFLAGDVMLGRGIDQILPYPGDPTLYERYMPSAEDYVRLAENVHGHIPRQVAPAYVWGDALAELDRYAPDLRIVNLETAVTTSKSHEPKGINYRMNPRNAETLRAFRIDCCTLANNHVLDWGRKGLIETIESMNGICIAATGAGRNEAEAQTPAILNVADGVRVLVFAAAMPTSGVPAKWAAGEKKAGISFLKDMSNTSVDAVAHRIASLKGPGDIAALSLHWGTNWGYRISQEEIAFAHALMDHAGVDLLHGHSSHHAKAVELYRGKLILYGCGDFINDYEGIPGHKGYRSDLALAYLASLDAANGGHLNALSIIPFQIRNFQLRSASSEDANWLQDTLTRESCHFGVRFVASDTRELKLVREVARID